MSKGSPFISLIIRNLSGSSPIIGLTLRATGLYFFLAGFFAAVAIDVNVGAVSEAKDGWSECPSSGNGVELRAERDADVEAEMADVADVAEAR